MIALRARIVPSASDAVRSEPVKMTATVEAISSNVALITYAPIAETKRSEKSGERHEVGTRFLLGARTVTCKQTHPSIHTNHFTLLHGKPNILSTERLT